MNRVRRALAAGATVAASAFLLLGCATESGTAAAPFGTLSPAPPGGEVLAQGTVLDTGGVPELCLGPVAESYPPQCSGIPLEGWTWEGVEGSDSSDGNRWGVYALQGTYDGDSFTVTASPIMLALYDPMPVEDPTGGKPGAGDEKTLATIQQDLPQRLGDDLLSSSIENGYLMVDVVWDDGSLQDAAVAAYGQDVVIVRSALRELG